MNTTPTRLAAIGMDQRQRNTLRMLFSTKCHNRYVLMEEDSSEIFILDLDVLGGERLWQEFRQRRPNHPLILISLNPREVEDPHTLFVKKPIPIDHLIAAIDKQSQSLNREACPEPDEQTDTPPSNSPAQPSQKVSRSDISPATHKVASLMSDSQEQAFVGTSPDIDPYDSSQLAKIYYEPEHYLQGHIQQALNLATRHNKNVAIEGPWPDIDLIIKQRRIMVNAEERHLRPYCTIPDSTHKTTLRIHDHDQPVTGRYEYPISAFLWQLALWASRGRLPAGTDISLPIELHNWPNFTRLTVTPYALAISALWAKQPHSLIETARALSIPQRYVFAFYSATKAVQLAGEMRQTMNAPTLPLPAKQSKQRGLFGRLLNRLRGHKDAS